MYRLDLPEHVEFDELRAWARENCLGYYVVSKPPFGRYWWWQRSEPLRRLFRGLPPVKDHCILVTKTETERIHAKLRFW